VRSDKEREELLKSIKAQEDGQRELVGVIQTNGVELEALRRQKASLEQQLSSVKQELQDVQDKSKSSIQQVSF
jgi:hypothetical protein